MSVSQELQIEKKKKIKVTVRGIDASLQMLKRAHHTMSGECRLRETARASCSGLRNNSMSPSMGEGQQQSSPSYISPPPKKTKLPVYNCSQLFTAATFHFLLPNPIAHYPVHCIRALIFPFSSSEEERNAFMINPLYSNK